MKHIKLSDNYLRNCTSVKYHRKTKLKGIKNARIAVTSTKTIIAHCLMSPGDAYQKYVHMKNYRLWHRGAPIIRKTVKGGTKTDEVLSRKEIKLERRKQMRLRRRAKKRQSSSKFKEDEDEEGEIDEEKLSKRKSLRRQENDEEEKGKEQD